MEKKCACGLPLDEKTTCSCQPDTCIYCCTCDEGCDCGCHDNNSSENEEEQEKQPSYRGCFSINY